ncbi:MAG: hypothetical protein PHX18_00610 [Candidatus Gastranaerophilales bacterium]|nr:hypothetical protein [Candidatus Gastranaerophilales bacterium]
MKIFSIKTMAEGIRSISKGVLFKNSNVEAPKLGPLVQDSVEISAKKSLEQLAQLTGLPSKKLAGVVLDTADITAKYPNADSNQVETLAFVRAMQKAIKETNSTEEKKLYQDALIKAGLPYVDFNLIINGRSKDFRHAKSLTEEIAITLSKAIKNKEEAPFPSEYTTAMRNYVNTQRKKTTPTPGLKKFLV